MGVMRRRLISIAVVETPRNGAAYFVARGGRMHYRSRRKFDRRRALDDYRSDQTVGV